MCASYGTFMHGDLPELPDGGVFFVLLYMSYDVVV
jgi:hypothetical protein